MRTASSKPKANGDPATGLFGDDDTIDLLGVFGVLRRRKWLIGGGTLLGTLVALAVSTADAQLHGEVVGDDRAAPAAGGELPVGADRSGHRPRHGVDRGGGAAVPHLPLA